LFHLPPQDPRVIQKLHRRVFLDKITRDEATIYLSFYVESANRDAFMAGAPSRMGGKDATCTPQGVQFAVLRVGERLLSSLPNPPLLTLS